MWLRTDLLPPWTHQSLGLRTQPLSNNISRGSAAASVKAAADYHSDQSVITHWSWSVSTHWFTIKKTTSFSNVWCERGCFFSPFCLNQSSTSCSAAEPFIVNVTVQHVLGARGQKAALLNETPAVDDEVITLCVVEWTEKGRDQSRKLIIWTKRKKHQEMNELMNEFVFSCEQISLCT